MSSVSSLAQLECDGVVINVNMPGSVPLFDAEGNPLIYTCDDFGCTDINAINYEEEVIDVDELCVYDIILGCTNPIACNYNQSATGEDGSCEFSLQYFDCEGNPINDSDADGIPDEMDCYSQVFVNGVPQFNAQGNPAIIINDNCISPGCTDPLALNYSSDATSDNASCIYELDNWECICQLWTINGDTVLPFATGALPVFASNGSTAVMYEYTVNPYYNCSGDCINDTDSDGVCDELEIEGCQEPTACNYDSSATDTAFCNYPEPYYNCDNSCVCDEDGDGVCCELEIQGCTDSLAINFNINATDDDGSCYSYLVVIHYEELDENYYHFWAIINGISVNFLNWDMDDGTSYTGISEPTHNFQENGTYNVSVNVYTSSGTYFATTTILVSNVISGCMDPMACNYNSEATFNNNSCIYPELYYDCDGNCINDFDLDDECDEVDYDDGIGIDEISEDTPTLIKMIDILGRKQQEHKKGSLLFYIYDNGKVEKKFNP